MEVIFYNPIVNLFLFFYKLLFENFVLTIIAVTLIVQLVLWPLSIRQYLAQKKIKTMQDDMKKIQEKRASGKQLTVAEMQMTTQMLKGFFAGCLPPLIQLPFLFFLYEIITKVAKGDGTVFNGTAYTDALRFPDGYKFHLDFFGLDLSKTIFNIGFNNIPAVIILVLIIGATVFAQYRSMKLSSPTLFEKKKKVQEIDLTEKKKKKKANEPITKDVENLPKEMEKTSQQMTQVLTYVILAMSIVLPAALSVYWLARSIFVIILTTLQKKYIIKEK